jgi:hypothetical protein
VTEAGQRRGRLTSGGGRLSGVDVADDDDVDMNLLLTAIDCQFVLLRWRGDAWFRVLRRKFYGRAVGGHANRVNLPHGGGL